eukprot:Clim_evm48s225 gene=Clim_evmTU48s225
MDNDDLGRIERLVLTQLRNDYVITPEVAVQLSELSPEALISLRDAVLPKFNFTYRDAVDGNPSKYASLLRIVKVFVEETPWSRDFTILLVFLISAAEYPGNNELKCLAGEVLRILAGKSRVYSTTMVELCLQTGSTLKNLGIPPQRVTEFQQDPFGDCQSLTKFFATVAPSPWGLQRLADFVADPKTRLLALSLCYEMLLHETSRKAYTEEVGQVMDFNLLSAVCKSAKFDRDLTTITGALNCLSLVVPTVVKLLYRQTDLLFTVLLRNLCWEIRCQKLAFEGHYQSGDTTGTPITVTGSGSSVGNQDSSWQVIGAAGSITTNAKARKAAAKAPAEDMKGEAKANTTLSTILQSYSHSLTMYFAQLYILFPLELIAFLRAEVFGTETGGPALTDCVPDDTGVVLQHLRTSIEERTNSFQFHQNLLRKTPKAPSFDPFKVIKLPVLPRASTVDRRRQQTVSDDTTSAKHAVVDDSDLFSMLAKSPSLHGGGESFIGEPEPSDLVTLPSRGDGDHGNMLCNLFSAEGRLNDSIIDTIHHHESCLIESFAPQSHLARVINPAMANPYSLATLRDEKTLKHCILLLQNRLLLEQVFHARTREQLDTCQVALADAREFDAKVSYLDDLWQLKDSELATLSESLKAQRLETEEVRRLCDQKQEILMTALENLRSENAGLKQENAKRSSKIHHLQIRIAELDMKLQKALEESETFRQQCGALTKKNDELFAARKYNQEIASISSSGQGQSLLVGLPRDLEQQTIHQEIVDLRSQLDSCRAKYVSQKKVIAEYRDRITETDRAVQIANDLLKETVGKSQAEIGSLQDRISGLVAVNIGLERRLMELEGELLNVQSSELYG